MLCDIEEYNKNMHLGMMMNCVNSDTERHLLLNDVAEAHGNFRTFDLIKAFNRPQHFDIASSGGDKVYNHSSTRIARRYRGGNAMSIFFDGLW